MAHWRLGVCCYITVWAWFRSAGSCVASGILLQFRRAPLHVLGNLLYSAFFVAWLVYRFLLGFSFVFLRGFFSKSVALAVSLQFILFKDCLTVSTRFLVSVQARFVACIVLACVVVHSLLGSHGSSTLNLQQFVGGCNPVYMHFFTFFFCC